MSDATRTPLPTKPPCDETVRAIPPSLWQRERGGIRCLACTRRCLLREGDVGFCTAVVSHDGALWNTSFGVVSTASVTRIENRPVFHYRPGARVLALGGLGCNLRCGFCQNWEVAFRTASEKNGVTSPNLLPDRAVALALERGCEGIAWTFNEPSIAPVFVLETAQAARQAGLFTVFVTNGMMTHQSLDLLGPWLDVYRVDIKSLDAAFYRRVAGTDRIEDILPVAARAQREFGIHVEAVTNLMPTLNDSDDHLARLAAAIVAHLGSGTPWHLTTYVPYALMTDIAPTPRATLHRARARGLEAGLRFIYTDDPLSPETGHTICPACGAVAIERTTARVALRNLDIHGACAACGEPLGIVLPPSHALQDMRRKETYT